jgi:threonine dehydratase
MDVPTFDDVRAAYERVGPYIHRTPVLTCTTLDRMSGTRLFFKCENFQKVGAFKVRGATNAVYSLSAEVAGRGVATHSSGNHAAALARAAGWRGIRCHVVMPENAPKAKQAAVRSYGGEIVYCQANLEAREKTLEQVVRDTGATFVHPYNDPWVIAGQGTAVLELLEELGNLDAVVTPIGGGGLISGTSITCAAISKGTRIYAAEPKNADDAFRSFRAGRIIPVENPDTIADGLRTSLGALTFRIVTNHVAEILTVSEAQIVSATRLIWERMKIVVEPSSAVPLAAILAYPDVFRDRRVGVILTGGNVDLDRLPWQTPN